jgi:diguanylate cyclase (GGDEF)-like protein/PAS domain S-box-containing protein
MDLQRENDRAGIWRVRLDELRPLLAFARRKLWIILLWPVVALVLAAIGWTHVHNELARAHRETLLNTEGRLDAYTEQFVRRTQREIADVDRMLLLLRHDWQASGGRTRLEGTAQQGIIAGKFAGVAILDAQGRLLTSSPQPTSSASFPEKEYFTAQRDTPGDKLFVSSPLIGELSGRDVIAFSRKLPPLDASFHGVVVLAVVPEYFTVSYTEGLFGRYGFLGIGGTDGVQLAASSASGAYLLRETLTDAAPLAQRAQGMALLEGKRWFTDGRNRYVGWRRVPGYDMMVEVGLEENEAFAPYERFRDNLLSWAWWNTAWLAIATLLAATACLLASWKKQQLEATRSAYRLATEEAGDGFFIERPVRARDGEIVDFVIVDCNHYGAALFGLRTEDVIGRRVSELYLREFFPVAMARLRKAWRDGAYETEIRVPDEERGRVPVEWLWYKAVRTGRELAVTVRDISERKAHVQELEQRSNEDALTGLPNRNWIQRHLPASIAHARETGGKLAVLFIDLDGFKTVNDALGHAAGDELLRTVGRRLKIAVRPRDHVVRLGGDEFVILLEGVGGPADVEHVATRVLDAFRDPFHLQASTHVLGASIGIGMFPEHGTDAETLLKNADIAMYSVKMEGKGAYRFFRPQFYEAIRTRLETEIELRGALERGEFVVYYQPRVSLTGGEMLSMEALVRWERPGRGLTGPNEFIPLAEQTGLIAPLGELVVDRVCRQLSQWTRSGQPVVPVSVNVSPRQFSQADILQVFVAAAQRHGVDPALLEIEVTESSMMQEGVGESGVFRALRELGIKLCIDDFGTGYSSLSQLQRLQFDVLKIDRAFVLQIGQPGTDTLISSMVAMAHALGMRVVAEGVETAQQMSWLRKLGCDEGQGFYFSRPVPASARPPLAEAAHG